MNRRYLVAAAVLLSSFATEAQVEAQGAPAAAAAAARRQKLAAQQAAAIASAKAAAAAAPTTAPTPVATINRPAPTAAPVAATTTASTATTAPPAAAAPSTPKATASAAPATSGSAAPAAAKPSTAAIALDIEALRKSRPERRHAEVVDLQARWGNLLSDPRAADELKLHAQRSAYLQRIRALSEKDPTFLKGVDALITKEETRSSDALNALRSGALPTSTAAAPAGATK